MSVAPRRDPEETFYYNACVKQSHEIEQTLGRVLGYPRYSDDQKNFPGAEGPDVCVGDHVAETLAMEAARKIMDLSHEYALVLDEMLEIAKTPWWDL